MASTSGVLAYLRVQEVGMGYGPADDYLDAEVIGVFDGIEGAFGFQLRNDGSRAAHEGMLALLRDAYNNGWKVTVLHADPVPPAVNVMAYAVVQSPPFVPTVGGRGGGRPVP